MRRDPRVERGRHRAPRERPAHRGILAVIRGTGVLGAHQSRGWQETRAPGERSGRHETPVGTSLRWWDGHAQVVLRPAARGCPSRGLTSATRRTTSEAGKFRRHTSFVVRSAARAIWDTEHAPGRPPCHRSHPRTSAAGSMATEPVRRRSATVDGAHASDPGTRGHQGTRAGSPAVPSHPQCRADGGGTLCGACLRA